MMAVTTSLVAGELTITGDGDNDSIAILGTANPGELTITGSDGTSVNGTVNGSVTIGGVTSNLIVNLGAGNDNLTLNRVYIAGNIQIDTSDGADIVRLGNTAPVSPTQDLAIDTGAGNDQVLAEHGNVYVGARFEVFTGTEDDSIVIQGASAIAFSDFQTREGNDRIFVGGYTTLSTIRTSGSEGIDHLTLRQSSADIVLAGLGDDFTVPTSGLEVGLIDTVYARREITLSGARSGATSSMTIVHCRTTQLEVQMGHGDNSIRVDANAINEPPFVVGSAPQYPRLDILFRPIGPVGPITSQILVQYNLTGESLTLLPDANDNMALVGNAFTGFVRADGGLGTNNLFLQGNTFVSTQFINFTITGS
jgi:hypothetical protein